MSRARPAAPGATRVCPHCRATILERESICPGCHHHLRAGKVTAGRSRETVSVLTVRGTVRESAAPDLYEYTLLVTVLDGGGAEVSRHVVAVGASRADEARSFALDVQVHIPGQ